MNRTININLDVLLKPQDYVRASFWFLFKKPTTKLLSGFAVILLLVSTYTWIQRPEQIPWQGFILPGLFLIILFSTYVRANQSLASNKSLQQKINYSFTGDGINATSPLSNGHTNWESILKAYE